MAVPNLEIVRPGIKDLIRKDFAAADALIDPNATTPLFDGEWVQIDANYNVVRYNAGATYVDGAAQNAGEVISYPIWAERGRYDVQALRKIPVLFGNTCELDELIFDATSLYPGAPLEVADMTYGGGTRRGVRLATGTHFVVGLVTRLFGTDKVRFLRNCC